MLQTITRNYDDSQVIWSLVAQSHEYFQLLGEFEDAKAFIRIRDQVHNWASRSAGGVSSSRSGFGNSPKKLSSPASSVRVTMVDAYYSWLLSAVVVDVFVARSALSHDRLRIENRIQRYIGGILIIYSE